MPWQLTPPIVMGSADRTLSLGDVSVFALNGVPPRPYPSWLQTTLAPLSLFQKSANSRSNVDEWKC